MRHCLPGLLVFGLALSLASPALAGDEDKPAKKAEGPRKDPEGITGVSPFQELVNKGNAAYVARDFAGAIARYQEAITKRPNHPLGHYLLGQAYLADNKLSEADSAWQSALRYSDKDPVTRAKVLFVTADLRERQQKWDEAIEAWKAYGQFVGANQNAKGYPATATERQKIVEQRKDLATKYGAVKERIAQRERDAAANAK